MAKWRNFQFRSTLAGDATWGTGGKPPLLVSGIPQPDDANQETFVVLPASANLDATPYPTTVRGVTFGFEAGTPTVQNLAPSFAADDPRLAGRHTVTSGSTRYVIDAQPGQYLIRCSFGNATGTTQALVIAGTVDQLITDIGTDIVTFFLPSTTRGADVVIASRIDGGFWKSPSVGGTSGTVEPSGAGPTFNDGGMIWTRLAVTAIYAAQATVASPDIVMGADGAMHPRADVLTFTRAATIPAGKSCVTIFRPANLGYVATSFGMQLQTTPLADVTLTDDVGKPMGTTPTLYAGQPSGYPCFRLNTVSGLYNVAAFALGGPLAAYYSPTLWDGLVWAFANGTPLPDSLAGARSLTVTQTDGGSSRTTTFNATVVSSQGKPTTGPRSLIGTMMWLLIKRVEDAHVGKWQIAPPGQAWFTDQVVTSKAELLAALTGIPNDTTTSRRHRIRIGLGDWSGGDIAAPARNWLGNGTGGVCIEPDTGVDPEYNVTIDWPVCAGIEIRGLRALCRRGTGLGPSMTSSLMFKFGDPGPGNGYWNVFSIHHLRAGIGGLPGFDAAVFEDCVGNLVQADHARQGDVYSNTIDGMRTVAYLNGVRLCDRRFNDLRRIETDAWRFNNAKNYDSTINVLPDNDFYHLIGGGTTRDEYDRPGYVFTAHQDGNQVETFQQNLQTWRNNALPDLDPSWSPTGSFRRSHTLNMRAVPPALYELAAITNGTASRTAATGNGPTGTANGQVDGDLVWNYFAPYLTASAGYIVHEAGFTASATPGNTGAYIGGRQTFIDSNGGRGCPIYIAWLDSANSGDAAYGVQISEGEIHMERSTFVPAAQQNTARDLRAATAWASRDGTVRARNCILGTAPYVSGSGGLLDQGNVYHSFFETASPTRQPDALMAGPFAPPNTTNPAIARWTMPALNYSGTPTVAAFTTQMRSMLASIADGVGLVPAAAAPGAWIEGAPLKSADLVTVTFTGLTPGSSRAISGAAFTAGFIKANNSNPLLVTAPVKGPNTPAASAVITASLDQTIGARTVSTPFTLTETQPPLKVLLLGSSTFEKYFTDGTGTADARVTAGTNGTSFASLGTTGEGGLALGTQLADLLGRNVRFIKRATGGTLLSQWEANGSSQRSGAVAAAIAAGGVDVVICGVGYNDAYNATQTAPNRAFHAALLRSFQSKLRSELGQPAVKIIMVGSQRITAATIEVEKQIIGVRAAEIDVGADVNNVFALHSYDIAQGPDNIHFVVPGGWVTHATRLAPNVAFALGTGAYRRGPRIVSAVAVSTTSTDVTLAHVSGNDFTPTTGITGFGLSVKSSGSALAISAAVRQSATVVRLTHADSAGSALSLTYANAAFVNATGVIKDNSADPRTIDPTTDVVSIAATAATTGVPVNTTAPAISGFKARGQTLRSGTGAWTQMASGTFAYQWYRGAGTGTPIGTNSPDYAEVTADVGSGLHCVVTATNSFGSVSQDSALTSPIVNGMIDRFTDTLDANLSSHVADTGETWTAAAGTMLIRSPGAYGSAVPAHYTSSFVPATADYSVSDEQVSTTMIVQNSFLKFRIVDATNYYVAGFIGGSGAASRYCIGKYVNGNFFELSAQAGGSGVQVANTVYRRRLVVAGNSKTLFVDSGSGFVQVAQDTADTTFTAKGSVGIRQSTAASSATTGTRVDNFAVMDAGA